MDFLRSSVKVYSRVDRGVPSCFQVHRRVTEEGNGSLWEVWFTQLSQLSNWLRWVVHRRHLSYAWTPVGVQSLVEGLPLNINGPSSRPGIPYRWLRETDTLRRTHRRSENETLFVLILGSWYLLSFWPKSADGRFLDPTPTDSADLDTYLHYYLFISRWPCNVLRVLDTCVFPIGGCVLTFTLYSSHGEGQLELQRPRVVCPLDPTSYRNDDVTAHDRGYWRGR